MKGNGYEHHYKNIPPPKDGMGYQRGQLTSVQRNKAKLGFNCDHCGLPFETYACWAKRNAHHYCGRACASAAKVVRIPKPCVVCGTEMLLTPTDYRRFSACSYKCSRKRRVVNNDNPYSSPDYAAVAARLKKNAVCTACGATSGPWVVRGMKTWVEDGLACASGDDAHLMCRDCHLKAVAPLAAQSTYMTDRFKYYKQKSEGEKECLPSSSSC